MATLCHNTTPLKRSALPPNVTWNGRAGVDFERYIDKFTGHVAQQSHMGYLLLEVTAMLWLKYGEPETVLRIGIAKNHHPSF